METYVALAATVSLGLLRERCQCGRSSATRTELVIMKCHGFLKPRDDTGSECDLYTDDATRNPECDNNPCKNRSPRRIVPDAALLDAPYCARHSPLSRVSDRSANVEPAGPVRSTLAYNPRTMCTPCQHPAKVSR